MDHSKRSDNSKDQTPDTTELNLVLPLPPSINHQYATVNGRRVLSRSGREYKQRVAEDVGEWLEAHRDRDSAAVLFRRHYLSLSITFYFVTALRRDLDGGLKIAQDALCEALGVNDNLVVEIHLKKRINRHHPRIEVRLAALPVDKTDLYDGGGSSSLPPMQIESTGKRRRGRRKRRSLEELATRYNWE